MVGGQGVCGGSWGAWGGRSGARWAIGGRGALTAAEQGLVHEPDVGEALLAGLGDAHLVAGEHVPVVLLDLQQWGRGAEWEGGPPTRWPRGRTVGTLPAASQDRGPLRPGRKTHTRPRAQAHTQTCAHPCACTREHTYSQHVPASASSSELCSAVREHKGQLCVGSPGDTPTPATSWRRDPPPPGAVAPTLGGSKSFLVCPRVNSSSSDWKRLRTRLVSFSPRSAARLLTTIW